LYLLYIILYLLYYIILYYIILYYIILYYIILYYKAAHDCKHDDLKTCGRRRGIAPRILNLYSRQNWVFSFTFLPLILRGNRVCYRAGVVDFEGQKSLSLLPGPKPKSLSRPTRSLVTLLT